MPTNSRSGVPVLLCLFLAAAGVAGSAQSSHHARTPMKKTSPRAAEAQRLAPLTDEEKAAQVLSRFSFGPRPGEIAEVARENWQSWFERQLEPASIPDPALDRRLAMYPSLGMTPQQIAINFPDGQLIRRVAEGRFAPPNDRMLAGAYEVMLLRYQRKQAEDKAASAAGATAPQPATDQQKAQDRAAAALLADQVLAQPKNQRMEAIMRLPVDQRMTLASSVADPEKTLLQNDFTPREKELFAMMGSGYGGNGVVANELAQAKLLRAVLTERQLQEVMTDFWFNHFNVDLGKSGDEINYVGSYERDAIRAHALGKFRDLLLATAQHPAMLIYLDNWLSIGPDSEAAGRPRPNAKNQAQKGLNENYGREVMELHTVSVDGGYSQQDVTSLAKILTGWTVDQPQLGGSFLYEAKKHQPGTKMWFGQKIEEAGYAEGVRTLSWLAAQPQTARFLSYKLAQRFVADEPPTAMVDRMAAAYMSSDGDIREVLRTMVSSPEFFSRQYYRNKVKMPLEFVASALRATGTDLTNPQALVGVLRSMGEPLYRCQPPTGYAATADHWMNSAALVDRLNFSLQLAGSKVGGIKFDGPRLLAEGLLSRPAPSSAPGSPAERVSLTTPNALSGSEEALALIEDQLVPARVSDRTNAVIRQEIGSARPEADPAQTLDTIAAMILGSPEFQMH